MGNTEKNCKSERILFERYKGSKNFMTPDVLEIGMLGNGSETAYEISVGRMMNKTIYGLSIAGEYDEFLSEEAQTAGCYSSLKEVRTAIATAKRMVKEEMRNE